MGKSELNTSSKKITNSEIVYRVLTSIIVLPIMFFPGLYHYIKEVVKDKETNLSFKTFQILTSPIFIVLSPFIMLFALISIKSEEEQESKEEEEEEEDKSDQRKDVIIEDLPTESEKMGHFSIANVSLDFEKAVNLYENKKPKAAIGEFTKLITTLRSVGFTDRDIYIDSLVFRGMAYQEMNDHECAIEDFSKVLSIDERLCNVYFLRSMSKRNICDFKGGIDDIKSAIEFSSVNNEHKIKMDIQYKKKGFSSAKAFYESIGETVYFEFDEEIIELMQKKCKEQN